MNAIKVFVEDIFMPKPLPTCFSWHTSSALPYSKDVAKRVRKYENFKRFMGKLKFVGAFPFMLLILEAPFWHWRFDFIGKIQENYNKIYKWILVSIDYFTKWVEEIPKL